MFRLNNDIVCKEELGTGNVNNIIKRFLERYFNDNYTEVEVSLNKEVKAEEVLKILPTKLLKEMKELNIDAKAFVADKVAAFMNLLNDKEEQTPDLFTEYLLSKMIEHSISNELDVKTQLNEDDKKELLKIITVSCKETAQEFEDNDMKITESELNDMITDYYNMYTDFRYLMGSEEDEPTLNATDNSIAFWDWDYMFIDQIGFAFVAE